MSPPDESPSGPESSQTVNIHHPDRHTASTDFELAEALESLGDYDLLEEIGSGGMGRVYKARQRSRGRVVALKTLLPRYISTPALVHRFRKEAEAAGRLDHPGIVPVYEINEAGGQFFYTMPLVEGRGLDQRLRQGVLDNRRAALIVQRVAEAVAHAHRMGVIHRDLKPGNILLDRDGGVKVTDFGLARRLDEKDLDALDEALRVAHAQAVDTVARLTRAGVVMGTPGYMAPEQAMAAAKAGPSADIWAMGSVLYACLTGRPPFVGATPVETLLLTAETEPVPPDEINPDADAELVDICLRCLRKDPAERYESADELAAALGRWREGQSTATPWEKWRARGARFLEVSPELVPLLTGLTVQRFGSFQEGIYVGCALAGFGVAARRAGTRCLAGPIIGLALFLLTLPAVWILLVSPAWLEGAIVSAAGCLGLALTVAGGFMAFRPPRPDGWWPQRACYIGILAGLPLLIFSIAAALCAPGLRDIDPSWAATALGLERVLGRAAGWLLAVPLGIATGVLLCQINQELEERGREGRAGYALGAAAMALAVAALLHELRPDEASQAARFSAAGAGPALSTADGMAAHWLPATPEARQAAAAGTAYLKFLLFAVPMGIGSVLAASIARLAGRAR